MPEHLRALMVVLVLALAVFAAARAPACALACAKEDFARRRNVWIAVTLAVFLAHNFWIYICLAAALLLFASHREPNKLALFFFLLFAVPRISDEIPALGVVNFLFAIDYLRLLTLVVLLPEFLRLRRRADVASLGRSVFDKLMLSYLFLSFVLMLEHGTVTSALRNGVFYAFVDAFLPYYVASRGVKNVQALRDALMSFVVAALVLCPILLFEFGRHWLLYPSLDSALGLSRVGNSYLELLRGDDLRATGSTGHPIAAGYVMAVATGFFLYLRKSIPNSTAWGVGLVLLLAGLFVPLSRGPWVGAAAMAAVFVATGPAPARAFSKLALLGIVVVPLVLVSPVGEKVIDLLPFVGRVETASVDFRQRLAEASWQVFLEYPILGRYNFLETPVMEALRGRDGLIDMVNTYAIVGLGSGVVGLSLFAGFFVAVAFSIYRGMRNLTDRDDERYLLGRALLATLLGILVTIGTASPTYVIPVIYWSVAGIGIAYARMLVPERAPPPGSTAFRSAPIKRHA